MLISNSIYSSQNISNSNRNEVSENYRNNDNEINQLLENPPSLKNNVKLRESIAETATSNKEQEIADSLLGAIDDHTIQLEAIGNWTEGGVQAFKGALEMIASSIISKGELSGADYENLMQIVMLDVLANLKEYDLDDSLKFKQFLAWSIEYTGSGQHNSWTNNLPDPANCTGETQPQPDSNANGCLNNNLIKIMNEVWIGIKSKIDNNTIPQNSLTYRLMQILSKDNERISNTLPSSVYEDLKVSISGSHVSGNGGYFDTNKSGWITDSNNNMSPLMRLVLLSNLLSTNPELSKNQLDTILYGDLKSINELVKNVIPNSEDVYKYIINFDNENTTREHLEQDDQGWQDSSFGHDTDTRPDGVYISLDFAGELDTSWLSNLCINYPKRVLGDEDIKEINRLGDSVKMIMQTLKYWFQIMRDERVAIARNI
ncbi:molecular chaperone [Vibrio cholerae]|uniref:molecular chaperone n=1 Tax=Vibrio cholerae TaxID=666 RepID=UPI0011D74E4A|nr:molecular chaperone [Vibrio cholerae]TYA70256.1 molecular chaperone [Vibrio cholerae]GIB23931.1 molecular chaperone [Vibrio cholerae]